MIGWILWAFFILIAVGGGILFLAIRLSKRNKVPPNSVLAINLNPVNSGGHAVGIELPSESNIWDDRKLINFLPIDHKYDNDGEPIISNPQIVPMRKERRIAIPAGGLSSYRTIAFYFPESFMDLPPGFRDTPVGMAFSIGTEAMKMHDDMLKIIKASNKTEAEVQRDVAKVEADFVKKADEMMRNFIRKEGASVSSPMGSGMNTAPPAPQF